MTRHERSQKFLSKRATHFATTWTWKASNRGRYTLPQNFLIWSVKISQVAFVMGRGRGFVSMDPWPATALCQCVKEIVMKSEEGAKLALSRHWVWSWRHTQIFQLENIKFNNLTSGQSNTTQSRIATAHLWFNRISKMSSMCTPSIHGSSGRQECVLKWHLDRFRCFCAAHGKESLYFTLTAPFPSKLHLCMGRWTLI